MRRAARGAILPREMNSEFHYYAVHFLCLRSGFAPEEARRIARSSQYVDDASVSYIVEDGRAPYRCLVTQNYVFWDEATLREVYLPFHFLPGDPERARRERRDGRAHELAASPDSPFSKELLVEALRSGDPYRLGIALHAYADGWAHQHFSGRIEEANALDPSSPLPPAGHLQALRSPDEALGRWHDPRLFPEFAEVNNRRRFLEAAKKIYRYLRVSRRLPFDDEELVLGELEGVWARKAGGPGQAAGAAPSAAQARTAARARLDEFVIQFDMEPYDKREWLREAGIAVPGGDEEPFVGYDKLRWLGSRLKSGGAAPELRVGSGGRFEGSELRRWDEAARAHLRAAKSLMKAAGIAEAQG